MRISWNQALTTVASELTRIKSTYGNSGLLAAYSGHQWAGSLHNMSGDAMSGGAFSHSGWNSRFLAAYGGATNVEQDSSTPGWDGGGSVIWGASAVNLNNVADILANCKLIIHWSTNNSVTSYSSYHQNIWLQQFKNAGIEQILIDPLYNEMGMLYCDQWIPILPGTDEAMMAAIAYVWITNKLHNTSFLSTHTVGFQQFSDYVTGVSDKTPKTPQWAQAITGISASVITALANKWASVPTFIDCQEAAANRRDNGPNFVRMIITLCAMLGNIGKPGAGLGGGIGGPAWTSVPSGTASVPGITAGAANPVTQVIRHGQFGDAILSPPVSYTVARTPDGTILNFTYPATGYSPIHAVYFESGSGRLLNQSGPINRKITALQSPQIEFVYSHSPWWEIAPKFSDIILPVLHVCERDDIIAWENYVVYVHTLTNNADTEAMNDMDIVTQLATMMGLGDITGGMNAQQWLKSFFTAAKIPNMTYAQFQQVGYYAYPFPAQTPSVTYSAWNQNPTASPLNTPSGLIEIYSQRVANAISSGMIDGTKETAIPTYIQGAEQSTASTQFPLYLTSAHAKFSRHSQWQNLTYNVDEPQMKINGYQTMLISQADANLRGLVTGDTARVFNSRGQILTGVQVTNRIAPGVIIVHEGGWYQPQQPGLAGCLDLGGNVNCLVDGRSGSPITSGLIENAAVQVEKWLF